MMLYSRKRVRYRRDGYCWKKRKDGKTTREDHMKLKVQGIECIYGCYVHSAILPTFHRRCYWLLQNPDIVLVHYLNVPYNDDNKTITPSLNFFADSRCKEWTRDDLISELRPMFINEDENDFDEHLGRSTLETIESIVQQLMFKQRAKMKSLVSSAAVAAANGCVQSDNNEMNNGVLKLAITTTTATMKQQKHLQQLTTSQQQQLRQQQDQLQMVQTNQKAMSSSSSTTVNQHHCVTSNMVISATGTDVNGNPIGSSTVATANTLATSSKSFRNTSQQQSGTVQLMQLTASSTGLCNLASADIVSVSSVDTSTVTTATVTAAAATSKPMCTAQPSQLIFNLSQIQSSFFILNSTTGNTPPAAQAMMMDSLGHQQTNNCDGGAVESVKNAQVSANPVAFIYGRTSATATTPVAAQMGSQLFCTAQMSKNNTEITHLQPHDSNLYSTNSADTTTILASKSVPLMVTTSVSSLLDRKPSQIEVKNEFDSGSMPIKIEESDVEMEMVASQRFSIDEDESMVMSDPPTPERMAPHNISLASSNFLSEEQNIKLSESEFLNELNASTHSGQNDAQMSGKSHSTLNELTLQSCNEDSDLDAFDSLFANDLMVIGGSQNESNYSYQTASGVPFDESAQGNVIIHHRNQASGPSRQSPPSELMQVSSHDSPFDTNHSMDFMDNDDIPSSEDIFFGLDTIDMFHDFDHLVDDLATSGTGSSTVSHTNQQPDNVGNQANVEDHHSHNDAQSSSSQSHTAERELQYSNGNPYQQPSMPFSTSLSLITPSASAYSSSTSETVSSNSDNSSSVQPELPSNDVIQSADIPQFAMPSTMVVTKTSNITNQPHCLTANQQVNLVKCAQLGNYSPANGPLSIGCSNGQLSSKFSLTSRGDNFACTRPSTTVSAGHKDCLLSTIMIKNTNINSIEPNNLPFHCVTDNESHTETGSINLNTSITPGEPSSQPVTVTVDQNGNLTLVKCPTTELSLSTTRRAASAGHQSSRKMRSQNLKSQLNAGGHLNSSDGTLNEIINDTEEVLLSQCHFDSNNNNNNDGVVLAHRRQRHKSDIYGQHSCQIPSLGESYTFNSVNGECVVSVDSSNSSSSPAAVTTTTTSEDQHNNNNNVADQRPTNNTATIADYSPEWCYPEGGIKVLVAGPWYDTTASQYAILFDGVSVPSQLVQNGLLRCFSPKHEPGFVTLQVSCNDVIISNSVIFEYRSHTEVSPQKTPDYFALDENLFKAALLERCEKLNQSTTTDSCGNQLLKQFLLDGNGNVSQCQLERSFVCWFDKLIERSQTHLVNVNNKQPLTITTVAGDKSLLHLCVCLNWIESVRRLLQAHNQLSVQHLHPLSSTVSSTSSTAAAVVSKRTSPLLVGLLAEIDPLASDQHGYTPFTWACALGHHQVARLMLPFAEDVIHLDDEIATSHPQSLSVLEIARQRGHHRVVCLIEGAMSKSYSHTITNKNPRPWSKLSLDAIKHRQQQQQQLHQHQNHKQQQQQQQQQHQETTSLMALCNIPSLEDEEEEKSNLASINFPTHAQLDRVNSELDLQSLDDLIQYLENNERMYITTDHELAEIETSERNAYFDENFLLQTNSYGSIMGEQNLIIYQEGQSRFGSFGDNLDISFSSPVSTSMPFSINTMPMCSSSTISSSSTDERLCEFVQDRRGSISLELNNLTLSETEQRKLYTAASVIQKFYRFYKDRKRKTKESNMVKYTAAAKIQSCYRRYKQHSFGSTQPTAASVHKQSAIKDQLKLRQQSADFQLIEHSEAKRFKHSIAFEDDINPIKEDDDDFFDEGLFSASGSSDISMANSSVQSEDEEDKDEQDDDERRTVETKRNYLPYEVDDGVVAYCDGSFSDEESNMFTQSLKDRKWLLRYSLAMLGTKRSLIS